MKHFAGLWQSISKVEAGKKTSTTKRPPSAMELQFNNIKKKSRILPAVSAYLVPLVQPDRRRLSASLPIQMSVAAPEKAEEICHLTPNRARTDYIDVIDAGDSTSRDLFSQPHCNQAQQILGDHPDGSKFVLVPGIGSSVDGTWLKGGHASKPFDECPAKPSISASQNCKYAVTFSRCACT